MERDEHIIHALVDIADNLVDSFDIVELLTKLADRCVEILGISAAGVMLAVPPGELRLIASSSEAMQVVELSERVPAWTPSTRGNRWTTKPWTRSTNAGHDFQRWLAKLVFDPPQRSRCASGTPPLAP